MRLDKKDDGIRKDALELRNRFLEGFPLLERRRQPNPYYYQCIGLQWAVIGGLTWRYDSQRRCTMGAAQGRLRDFNRLIRKTCGLLHLYRDDLVWYFKNEYGKSEGGHSHFLIGKTGLRNVSPVDLAKTMTMVWTEGTFDGSLSAKGTAKIEPFDERQQHEGVSYTCKREFDIFGYECDPYDTTSSGLKKIVRLETALQSN